MSTTTVGWRYSHCIGRNGHLGPSFQEPNAIAVAPGGILYVLNRGFEYGATTTKPMGKRVNKLTIDEELLGDFGTSEFVFPAGLALESDGTVYCSDEYRNLILVYDGDGRLLGQWGEAGSEEGQLKGPSGLAFDGDGNLHVVDSLNDRVQTFTKDGGFLGGWGGCASGEGQLDRPWGITVDGKDDVYVADWGNDRVQKFSPDGEFLMSFGSSDDGNGLDHPADVAVDRDGDVCVTDWGNKRVQIYDRYGALIATLRGDATELSAWASETFYTNPLSVERYNRAKDLSEHALFERPLGIAVDEQDRLIVSETNRCRLQIYTKQRA